jgi:hypothetical protein
MSQVLLDRVAMMDCSRHVFRNMLEQGATAKEIHQLHARANCEDWNAFLNCILGNTAIEIFATLGHDFDRWMCMHFHPSWIKIQIATGQNDAVNILQHAMQIIVTFYRSQQHRQPA